MAECLINYIGLDGVDYTPPSNLYVNRELNLPVSQARGMVNAEQGDLTKFWTEVQTAAAKKFEVRISLGMFELFTSCCTVIDEDWICDNRADLQMPWVYFLGAELMAKTIHTDRINRYTTVDKQKAADLREEFTQEYKVQLKAALKTINTRRVEPVQDLGQIFTYVEVLP